MEVKVDTQQAKLGNKPNASTWTGLVWSGLSFPYLANLATPVSTCTASNHHQPQYCLSIEEGGGCCWGLSLKGLRV